MSDFRRRFGRFLLPTRVLVNALVPSVALLAGLGSFLTVTSLQHREAAEALSHTTRHLLITTVRTLADDDLGLTPARP